MAAFENVTVGLHDSLTGGGGGLQKIVSFPHPGSNLVLSEMGPWKKRSLKKRLTYYLRTRRSIILRALF